MSQVLNQEVTKAQEKTFLREIENLFLKLEENNRKISQENKQIEHLRKKNEKSFVRLKQAVENLRTY